MDDSTLKILERYEQFHQELLQFQRLRTDALVRAVVWLGAAYFLRLKGPIVSLVSAPALDLGGSIELLRILAVVLGVALAISASRKTVAFDYDIRKLANHLSNVVRPDSGIYPVELYRDLAITQRPADSFPYASVAWAIPIAGAILILSQLLMILEVFATYGA